MVCAVHCLSAQRWAQLWMQKTAKEQVSDTVMHQHPVRTVR